ERRTNRSTARGGKLPGAKSDSRRNKGGDAGCFTAGIEGSFSRWSDACAFARRGLRTLRPARNGAQGREPHDEIFRCVLRGSARTYGQRLEGADRCAQSLSR